MERKTHIVALSSGILGEESQAVLLKDYIFSLTDSPRPKVCFIPTATGDSADSIVSFYSAFPADRYLPVHLSLFNRTIKDLRLYVLAQEVIVVAGGNTANLLAIWRTHGLDSILCEAWQGGTILCGWSAGGLCWFEGGSTDSFGRDLSPIDNCLGFLPGSFCPHYDSEERRRDTYHQFVAEGLPGGWALDNGTALHFGGNPNRPGMPNGEEPGYRGRLDGPQLRGIVSAKPGAMIYRVEKVDGEVRETTVEPELLLNGL